MTLTYGSLCSGYGGLDLAVEEFFGAAPAWFAEFEDAPSRILAHHWPGVPNLGDVTRVEWASVRPVDIICAGTPCQDLATAGKRLGMREGTRSNLWVEMRDAIAVLQPSVVVWENVRGALSAYASSEVERESGLLGEPYGPDRPGLTAILRVLGDLAELGFDAEVVPVLASDVGAPHERFRVFVVAIRQGADVSGWGGRGDAVLIPADGIALLKTPPSQLAINGGSQHPEKRKDGGHGPTLADEVEHLLPTPAAMNPNDEEDLERWAARRERVKAEKRNGNGFGTPLGVAARLLPTPQAHDAVAGKTPEQVAAMRERTGAGVSNLNEIAPLMVARPSSTDSVAEYEALWASLEDQSPFWVTADGVDYWPAIERWTRVLGRSAPSPTLPDGKGGKHRLNARLAEWMMGQAAGHITAPEIGLSRNEQLKACGNGVVTQQALLALSIAWRRLEDVWGLAA